MDMSKLTTTQILLRTFYNDKHLTQHHSADSYSL